MIAKVRRELLIRAPLGMRGSYRNVWAAWPGGRLKERQVLAKASKGSKGRKVGGAVIFLQTIRFRNDSATFAYYPINSYPRNLDLLLARQAMDCLIRYALAHNLKRVVIEPLQKRSFWRAPAKSLAESQGRCVPSCVTKKCGSFFR
ncbi:MAG: hypothetical protein P8Y58_14540 [Novosphingobium sp.]